MIQGKPLISIIVPVYNVEQYLEECVVSILHQTYPNLEIILVDDGSPDRSPEICDEYAQLDSRIKVVHKKNGGLSSARNVGLSIATGKYIGFVDSDDWISPDMYEKMEEAFSINSEMNIGIVACQVNIAKDNITDKFAKHLAIDSPQFISHTDFVKDLLYGDITDMVWNKLYKSDLVKGVTFMEGRNNEDTLYNYQISYCLQEKALNLLIISDRLYYYRYNTNGIMNSKKKPIYLDILRNDSFYIDDSKNRSPIIYTYACKRFVRDMLFCYSLFVGNRPWNKYLEEISMYRKKYGGMYAYIKDCIGLRHKCMYFIIWYFPLLWRIKYIRIFCSKRGEYIPI